MSRTYFASAKVRARRHGFRHRMSTKNGRQILSNRRRKDRTTICA